MNLCGLCKKTKILKNSHLLPKAVYKILSKENPYNDSSILIHKSKSLFMPHQTAKPFLCADCEDRLSKFGETYVLSQCMRQNGEFLLRNKIEEAKLKGQTIDSDIYSLKALEGLNTEKYLYFATSVFWRAASTSWVVCDDPQFQIKYEKQLLEDFRKYLLGQAAFPKRALISMSVFYEHDSPALASLPWNDPAHNNSLYRFCIPGIQFCLFTNQSINSDDIMVVFESFYKSGLCILVSKDAKTSVKKGKLKNYV